MHCSIFLMMQLFFCGRENAAKNKTERMGYNFATEERGEREGYGRALLV